MYVLLQNAVAITTWVLMSHTQLCNSYLDVKYISKWFQKYRFQLDMNSTNGEIAFAESNRKLKLSCVGSFGTDVYCEEQNRTFPTMYLRHYHILILCLTSVSATKDQRALGLHNLKAKEYQYFITFPWTRLFYSTSFDKGEMLSMFSVTNFHNNVKYFLPLNLKSKALCVNITQFGLYIYF